MKYYLKLKEHRPVLTAHDAYEVLLSLNGNPELDIAQLRIPSFLMTDDTDYFWVATNQRELFAVKIGMKCEVLHAPHGSSGLYKVKDGTVKIVLKDCSAETDENTKLYVECEYNAANKEFKVKGLFVEGCQIVDFPHTYWKAECLRADNTIDDGCCGDLQWWYKLADNTISKTYHQDAIGRVAVWNGFKCIREYRDGDKPTIESMMRVWRAILSEYGTKYRDWTPLGDML